MNPGLFSGESDACRNSFPGWEIPTRVRKIPTRVHVYPVGIPIRV